MFCIASYCKIGYKTGYRNLEIQVDTGDQILIGTLTFAEKDNTLTVAVVTGEGDVFPVTKVETKPENMLYFEIKLDNDLIKVTLKMDGDKLKGTGSNYQGEFVVTGEKQK
jgi:hypothetical protein